MGRQKPDLCYCVCFATPVHRAGKMGSEIQTSCFQRKHKCCVTGRLTPQQANAVLRLLLPLARCASKAALGLLPHDSGFIWKAVTVMGPAESQGQPWGEEDSSDALAKARGQSKGHGWHRHMRLQTQTINYGCRASGGQELCRNKLPSPGRMADGVFVSSTG